MDEADTRADTDDGREKFNRAERGRSIELETMENNRFERLRHFGEELPKAWYAFTGSNFNVYENKSYTGYDITDIIPNTAAAKDIIRQAKERLRDGANTDVGTFDNWTDKVFQYRGGSNTGYSSRVRYDGTATPDDGMDVRAQGSENGRLFDRAREHKKENTSRNKQLSDKIDYLNYRLNNDETLTKEQKTAIRRELKKTREKLRERITPTRFSMASPIEGTDRLVALHNINSDGLAGALELGGLAMPSFAVMNAGTIQRGYGDITIVASKDSINPKNNDTSIYAGDAWTPTFPDVGIKIREDAAEAAESKVRALLEKAGYDKDYSLALDEDNLQDQITR